MSDRDRLLAWFDREQRRLPWRASREPWPVLVSELMLQQTRVEVVLRYFEPFLARFPAPEALAHAEESEVLAAWSGLGYYRRARALKKAAEAIVARGSWPATAAELERLPGVGGYTAAAVASIAFGQRAGVVDGNVVRVMARRLVLAGRCDTRGARALILVEVERLLHPERPGDSNQALMELGATVCKPRTPRCELCPLAAGCLARAAGEPERYPEPRPRATPIAVAVAAAAVERDGGYLLVRRGDDEELLPGLWELPATPGAEPDAAAFRARYGGEWSFGRERARIRHTITFRTLTISAYAAEWTPSELREPLEPASSGWFSPEAARALPLSGAARKLLRKLEDGRAAVERESS